MQAGDKVYSQSKGQDVIIIKSSGSSWEVCDLTGRDYFKVQGSDLLEYGEKVTPKRVIQEPKVLPNFAPSARFTPRVTPTQNYLNSDVEWSAPSLTQNKVKKEGFKMNLGKLFGEFGKVRAGEVALTFGGQIAIRRSAEEYVSYDAVQKQIVNQMSMVLTQASDMIFILPVTAVEINDVIKFKGDYYQVLGVNTDGSVAGINLNKGTKSTICKETNLFGINFYYKVQSLFSTSAPVLDKDGNPVPVTAPAINPLMLMMLSKDGSSDFDDLLPLLLMGGGLGGATGGLGGINPLMLMMMGDKGGTSGGMKDMLPLLLMSGVNGGLGGSASTGAIDPMMLMLLMK